METIIFLGAQKYGTSKEIIEDTKKMGFKTILITSNENYIQKNISYKYIDKIIYVNDLNNYKMLKNIINRKIKNIKLQAIISVIEDYMLTSIKLNNYFCNTNIDSTFYKIFNNKLKMRKFFENTKYNIKNYTDYSKFIKYPCIFKLPISSGSKDVHFIETKKELKRLCSSYNKYLIEEYIKGPQYLVEVIIEKKKIKEYFIIKQEIKKFDKFIVIGYGLNPNKKDKKIENLINYIIKNTNINTISFHMEIRKIKNEYKVIEINTRVSGGLVNKLIKYGSNFSITKWIINSYIKKIYKYKKKNIKVYASYKVSDKYGIVKKITGVNKSKKLNNIIEIKKRNIKGKYITPPTSMGKRYIYAISKGETLKDAKKISKEALSNITIHYK